MRSKKNSVSSKGRRFLESGCDFYEAGDFAAAFEQFCHAARLGNPNAQLNLGNMYDDGEGVNVNFKLAVHYYKLAVANGLSQAAYNLGIAYKNRNNELWSRFWLRRAIDMGDIDAKVLLEHK